MRLVGIGGFVVEKSNKVISELLMNNKANELFSVILMKVEKKTS